MLSNVTLSTVMQRHPELDSGSLTKPGIAGVRVEDVHTVIIDGTSHPEEIHHAVKYVELSQFLALVGSH